MNMLNDLLFTFMRSPILLQKLNLYFPVDVASCYFTVTSISLKVFFFVFFLLKL
jgi:hypothetical protein